MASGADDAVARRANVLTVPPGRPFLATLARAVMAGDLNPQKARLLLMLSLHQGKTSQRELQAAFDR